MIASGGPRNSPPGTLTRLFFGALAHDKPDAMQVKVNGQYTPISSRTVGDRVRRLALGLQELGVQAGERVAIFSENRPEWAIADYACLTALLTDVPLYPNLPPEQAAYILNDSGAVAIFVSDAVQAAKIAEVRGKCTKLRHVITFAAEPHAGAGPHHRRGRGARRRRGRRGSAGALPGSMRSRCSPTTWRRSSTPRARRASRRESC
jgi:long-chain acyl-CoA synthetase